MAVPERELEEFEEKQQWWWIAEKKRSKRLDYLRKAVWKKGSSGGKPISDLKLDLEPSQVHIELHKAHKHEPPMLRRAKIVAGLLDAKTIYITDHAQLVGNNDSIPSRIPWTGSGGMSNRATYNTPGILPGSLVRRWCDRETS